jgi:hypothetical protein
MDLLIKHTCEDTSVLCYRWFWSLHVVPFIFSAHQKMNAEKNIYLFSVNGATIYADLDNNRIVNTSGNKIKIDAIVAKLGRNKRVTFKLTYENKVFIWCYRHTKASNMSELYLLGKKRLDPASSDGRRGVLAQVTYDGVVFVCEWKPKLPDGSQIIPGKNTIVVKNEEPDPDQDDEMEIAAIAAKQEAEDFKGQ